MPVAMEPWPAPLAERMLRLLTEQSEDHAFMFLDLEGRVAWWSEGARKIFGYESREIVGKPSAVLFTPEDVAAGAPQYEIEVGGRNSPAEDDRWMARNDGSRFWAAGILIGIRDAGGKLLGFGKILRNRTDNKEQLEALRNLAQDLEATSRRKDAFLGTLSHELRNPLAPIANAVAIIRQATPQVGTEVSYALKVVERQMHLIERLVEDLMDLTRVGAGKIQLKITPLVVQELLLHAVDDCGEVARRKRHNIEILALDSPIHIEGDRERLHQVFVNLITNAAKYTPDGGRILVKATTEDNEAVMKVEDNGLGIPPDMLPKIFDLFTQVETTRGASQGGLGIGLALVKNLVALHGGTVQASSDGEGKGAAFSVRLPLATPAA